MPSQNFTVTGFKELADQMDSLFALYSPETVLKRGTANSIRKALQPVLERVISSAPYDAKTNTSGIHLRETAKIQVRIPNEADKRSNFYHPGDVIWGIVSVKKSAVSLSQEFGNRRTPAHPYLRVSFQATAEESLSILKEQLASQLKNFTKKMSSHG